MLNKKSLFGLIALTLIVIMAAGMLSGCKLDGGNQESAATEPPVPTVDPAEIASTKVVMSSKHFDLTLYDVGQAIQNGQYYLRLMYGLITAEQFYDSVIKDLSSYLYIVNAAVDDGFELTQDELDEIDRTIADQLEQVLLKYEEDVAEDVEDKRAQAKANLEADLASDGLDFDSFIQLATNNMRMSKIASKYYEHINDTVEVTDQEIGDYIFTNRAEDSKATVSEFVSKFSEYCHGNGACPTYIVADCFSVNHIALMYETESDDEGNVTYLTESRADDEFKIEQRLDEIEDFDGFMSLEEEYGEDPGMDNELYRENGYIIHPDLISEYYDGFVYAAMNLHEGEWEQEADPDAETPPSKPALEFFKLKDGTKVVKVRTQPGVHYIIVNKEFKKGVVDYEKGDAVWTSWKNSIAEKKLDSVYEELLATWKEKYEIAVDADSIKAKFPIDSEKK